MKKYMSIFSLIAVLFVTVYIFNIVFTHSKLVMVDEFYDPTTSGLVRIDYLKLRNVYPALASALNFYDSYDNKSTIYIVTPTYRRATQMADLIVLRNTLALVPKIVWIVIEDAEVKSERIRDMLQVSNLNYVHLNIPSPTKSDAKNKVYLFTKGVYQRNEAIKWLRERKNEIKNGILYFADDDNRYDVRIFEDMRSTQRVSVWPVGLVAELYYEGPVCKNNQVVDWLTVFRRKFSVDMAGFATNLQHLFKFPNLEFGASPGWLESKFLQDLNCTMDNLETKAHDCKVVWVWHTKTKTTHPLLDATKLYNRVKLHYDPVVLDTA